MKDVLGVVSFVVARGVIFFELVTDEGGIGVSFGPVGNVHGL